MRTAQNISLACLVLSLFSCASSVEPVKYYSLSLNANSVNSNKALIFVGPAQLPKFLQQSGMVMQIGGHEIYTASFHRWAEQLDKSIIKLVVSELNKKSTNYHLENFNAQNNINNNLKIKLEFERFHITDKSNIIASGRYLIYEKGNILRLNNDFYITKKLEKNGYLHSVEKLKSAIVTLSDQIHNSLNSLD